MKNTQKTIRERKWVFYQPVFEVDNVQSWHREGPWSGHRPFAYDLVRFLRPKIIVELGTHYGTSFYTFCQAVKEGNLHSQCIAIDSWEGDPHSGFYGNEVYETVRDIANRFFPGIHTLLRSRFSKAVTQFDDGSIDLLHIDGYHTLEAVTEDYETWLPKLRSNGVILFHDIAHTGENFGVYILWDKLSREYPSRAFLHSWGLGVLWPKGAKGYEPLLEFPWELVQTLYEQKGHIVQLDGEIGQKEYRLKNIEGEVQRKEHQINELNMAIRDKDEIIKNIEGEVQEKEQHINELNVGIRNRDDRIRNIEGEVQEKEQHINELNVGIRNRDDRIRNMEGELNKILQLKSIRLHRRIEEVLRKLRLR